MCIGVSTLLFLVPLNPSSLFLKRKRYIVAKMSSQKEDVNSEIVSSAGIKTEMRVEFHPLLTEKLQEHFPNYVDVI